MNRIEYLNRINNYATKFVLEVEGFNAANQYHINIHAENFLIPILNQVYGLNLENLNSTQKKNYPAVDLADFGKRVAFQITATSTTSKIEKTIKSFFDYSLHNTFDTLYIYILTHKKPKYNENILKKYLNNNFVFNSNQHIIDKDSLFQKINNITSTPKINTLANIFEYEFSDIRIDERRNNIIQGEHGYNKSRGISNYIKEPDFKDRLKAVCESLKDDLRSIDINTKWSSKNLIPLDAEVEIIVNGVRKRKIADLMQAINSSDDRIILLLGDPGSGKSVALRKYCQFLAEEFQNFKYLPIYINLREWTLSSVWDDNNLPTIYDLHAFIKGNVMSRDIVLSKFFDKYYDILYEKGYLYFVLDSFDEIPSVLNAQSDTSILIKTLSGILFKFLKGARQAGSKSILASRIYRKPTAEFQTNTVFEIRSLNESKILKLLQKNKYLESHTIVKLFSKRPDLISIAKNPFTASLLSEFLDNNKEKFPLNQSELYSDYITSQLFSASERMFKNELDLETILFTTNEIAFLMFKKFGFEISMKELRAHFPNRSIDKVIDILQFTRIARIGPSEGNFSFSHRRFCEYFVVQHTLISNIEIDLFDIPNDSQWRDALVLLSEVSNLEIAKKIANFCWQFIKNERIPLIQRTRTLRFMKEAFRNRKECIVDFNEEFFQFMDKRLQHHGSHEDISIIYAKIMVEATGLLNPEQIDSILLRSMSLNISWINDTAFKSARHLNKFSYALQREIINYIRNTAIINFYKLHDSLLFSLKLSQGLDRSLNYFYWRRMSLIVLGLTFFLSIILFANFTGFYIFGLCVFLIYYKRFALIIENFIFETAFKYSFLFCLSFILLEVLFSKKHYYSELIFSTNYSIYFISIILLIFITVNIILDVACLKQIKILKKLVDRKKPIPEITVKKPKKEKPPQPLTPREIEYKNEILMTKLGVILGISVSIPLLIYFDIVRIIAIITMALFISYIVIKRIYTDLVHFLKGRQIFKQVNLSKCDDREYIYQIFKDLKKHKYFQGKFISYLEKNIKVPKGEWPSYKIFKLVHMDENSIRLAQLEEKWLGLDR